MHIYELPEELIVSVLAFVDGRQLPTLHRVSKTVREVVVDNAARLRKFHDIEVVIEIGCGQKAMALTFNGDVVQHEPVNFTKEVEGLIDVGPHVFSFHSTKKIFNRLVKFRCPFVDDVNAQMTAFVEAMPVFLRHYSLGHLKTKARPSRLLALTPALQNLRAMDLSMKNRDDKETYEMCRLVNFLNLKILIIRHCQLKSFKSTFYRLDGLRTVRELHVDDLSSKLSAMTDISEELRLLRASRFRHLYARVSEAAVNEFLREWCEARRLIRGITLYVSTSDSYECFELVLKRLPARIVSVSDEKKAVVRKDGAVLEVSTISESPTVTRLRIITHPL